DFELSMKAAGADLTAFPHRPRFGHLPLFRWPGSPPVPAPGGGRKTRIPSHLPADPRRDVDLVPKSLCPEYPHAVVALVPVPPRVLQIDQGPPPKKVGP